MYNYIPTNYSVLEHIVPYLKQKISILDVGSGLGEFMVLLKYYSKTTLNIDINVSGIEIDESIKNYVKIPTVFINAFDFDQYDKYDLIYLYQPIKDVDKMQNLLKYIITYKNPIIYNNSNLTEQYLTEIGFNQLKNNIWYFNDK